MNDAEHPTVYILGAGVVGMGLAGHLVANGRRAVLVRTSAPDIPPTQITLTVHDTNQGEFQVVVVAVSLAQMPRLDGIIVIAAKAFANAQIVGQLEAKQAHAPVLIMQNGIGVEEPFRQAGFTEIYRCVLYSGGEKGDGYTVRFRAVGSSPVGVIAGSRAGLEACVARLSTPGFPLHVEDEIQREIWKKGIVNSVFNTVCPLLDTDNGVFDRDPRAEAMAAKIVDECIDVTRALDIPLTAEEVMAMILGISRASAGQLVSTLQDIRNQRPTEIDALNLAIARIGGALSPPVDVPNTRLLGELVQIKASMAVCSDPC